MFLDFASIHLQKLPKWVFVECKKKEWRRGINLFRNLSTFIAARCSRVSPLWFLFITAGLPELARPTDAAWELGDFLPGVAEGLSLCPPLELLVVLSQLGLVGDRGLRTTGDICPSDFLLQPGELLGRFGVVSNTSSLSPTMGGLGECFGGEILCCFSESTVLRSFVIFWTTLMDMLWTGETSWFISVVWPPEGVPLMVLNLSEDPCGTWRLSAMTAGLAKETLLLDLFTLSAQSCSFSINTSTSSVIPHCWLIVSSLLFFMFRFVCLGLILVAPCTNVFMLAAFFLADLFFLFFFSLLHLCEEDELESWEDEVKLKTDRSCCWAEMVSDCDTAVSPEDLLSITTTSEGFSTVQCTFWLRGLNQILKFFFCLKTGLPGWVWISVTEESAKIKV